MREANVFRKNRAFYSGVILTVVEGLLSGCSCLSIYMLLRTASIITLHHLTFLQNSKSHLRTWPEAERRQSGGTPHL